MRRVYLDTYYDDLRSFQELFKLCYHLVELETNDIIFDFSRCNFLKQNAVVMLGGIARSVQDQDREFIFDWNTAPKQVLDNLKRNQFYRDFAQKGSTQPGNSIPYRQDMKKDQDAIVGEYLLDNWLGRGWVDVSEELKEEIASPIWEIYENAFTHSGCRTGVYSCGQRFPQAKTLNLSVADFGVGIVESVQQFWKRRARQASTRAELDEILPLIFSERVALEWAFQEGNSTRQLSTGGIGLSFLKEFIQLNHGSIAVFSNGAYLWVDDQGASYKVLKSPFSGTFVNIILNCDAHQKRYILGSE